MKKKDKFLTPQIVDFIHQYFDSSLTDSKRRMQKYANSTNPNVLLELLRNPNLPLNIVAQLMLTTHTSVQQMAAKLYKEKFENVD